MGCSLTEEREGVNALNPVLSSASEGGWIYLNFVSILLPSSGLTVERLQISPQLCIRPVTF